jgi:hypothetical protein
MRTPPRDGDSGKDCPQCGQGLGKTRSREKKVGATLTRLREERGEAMTPNLTPETPKEAFVVEVCIMGREKVGPWRVEFGALEEQARDRARGWNADRPAGYTHRVVRYVPEARLAALQERLETLTDKELHQLIRSAYALADGEEK